MSEDISIGNRIARLKGDRSQVQFAKDLGVSQSLLSEWLSGVSLPSAPGYVKIAMQAAKSDPSESLFFWAEAGLDRDAVIAAANEVLKTGGANIDAILATAEAKLNERTGNQKRRAYEGKDVIVPPYAGAPPLDFDVSVPAALISNKASTYYLVAQPTTIFSKVGHGVAPGEIIVFDTYDAAGAGYGPFIGEKVVVEFDDGLFVGMLGYLNEGPRKHLAIGPADEFPTSWHLNVTPHLRLIWSSGIHPDPGMRASGQLHEVRRFLGIWKAQFSTGTHGHWKNRARAAAPEK